MSRADLPALIEAVVGEWLSEGLGRRWVLAVSGGCDSVAMLHALATSRGRLGLELSVAHLDHGERGEAGRADGRFVADLAESLGIPFDLGHWKPVRKTHFETDARQARYDWLAEIARERNANAVAVAHTRRDQAETVLHRILRGTGPDGLAGIPPRRPLADGIDLVRPVLEIDRPELEAYLRTLGQGHREDATNSDLRRTRNRIRHDLLPRLAAEYNPRVVEALARLADLMRASRRPDVVLGADESAHAFAFDLDAFRRLPQDDRVDAARRAWRNLGFPEREMSARRWVDLAAWADRSSGVLSLPGGIVAVVEPSRLLVRRRGEPKVEIPLPEPTPLPLPGSAMMPEGVLTVDFHSFEGSTETIDADALEPPLHIDAPRPGDRFEPLGMEGRSTPLADFLRGRGLKAEARARVPVLRDRVGVVWVVGHRIAHRVRITDATTRRFHLGWIGQNKPIDGCD